MNGAALATGALALALGVLSPAAGCIRVHVSPGGAGSEVADPAASDLPLVRAAWSGDEAMLRAALAEVDAPGTNACDRDARSALGAAALAGSPEAVRMLLDAGARPNGNCEEDNPLHQVLEPLVNERMGSPDATAADGVTFFPSELPRPPSREYGTPADAADRVRIVELLLGSGADPDWPKGNARPIATAVLSGNEKITRLLIEHGADPDLQETFGLLARVSGSSELYDQALAWRRDFLARH